MKICVLISSHSPSFFTKMTVKSLLREVGGHDLSIHVGFHSNLGSYTNDFSMFSELRGSCQFHAVDEIDWELHNEDNYRYSRMHAKNLENLMKNVKYEEFDYLCVLDNDLLIKKDFVTTLIQEFPSCDLMGCLFDDRKEDVTVRDSHGDLVAFAPKISVWHLMMTRKFYDSLMRDTKIIYPKFIDGVFHDTFSEVFKTCENACMISSKEMSDMIRHFWGSSYNYGIIMNKRPLEEPMRTYEENFGEESRGMIK